MLQKYKTKREEGFTIIEVLIVLAIAGLILLIVFLAVPALQRNARNNARNNEASRISSTVTDCLANRNGQQDSCDELADLGLTVNGGVLEGYQQFENVTFTAEDDAAGVVGTEDVVNIDFGVTCTPDGSNTQATGASARDFAVTYQRENEIDRCIGSQSN
jgi:prepilin-type N-terminal cleavage/methylation domain-containing protein